MAYKTDNPDIDRNHKYYQHRWNRLAHDKVELQDAWKTQNWSAGDYFAKPESKPRQDPSEFWRSSGRACTFVETPNIHHGQLDLSSEKHEVKVEDKTLKFPRSRFYAGKDYPTE